jgi:RNA polymerase sigma-70 factor (ECF subfamily)
MGTLVSLSIPIRAADALSDADLVARALDGERWGREMLYRRHASSLLALTTRLLRNRSEAEEVVQDTFVTGFEQLATLRDPAAVRPWLGQIAVSLVRRRIRRGKLTRLLGLDRGADDATLASLAARDVGPDQLVELRLVDRLLAEMRTELRLAWMLRRVEGLELAEVASLCGCSLATAKRRISDADEIIRKHVGEMEVAS